MRLPVHLREHPPGTFVATALPWCGARESGPSADAAVEQLAKRVGERSLPHLDAATIADISSWGDPELRTVVVEVQSKLGRKEEPLRLTVGYALFRRQDVLLLRVPQVPEIDLAIQATADADAAAVRAVVRSVRKWRATAILEIEERGSVSTRIVEVEARAGDDDDDDDGEQGGAILDQRGTDLSAHAAAGRLGGLDRRDELVSRSLAALARQERCSVLLVGPNDVGKTALVHELAQRLHDGRVPEALKGRRLVRLTANELVAGASYTGMWQGQTRALIAQARKDRIVVAMGDPVGIIDAGRWSKSDNNMARLLRPFVESGEISLICECTPEGLARAQRDEPGFTEAFQRIDVPEADAELAALILDDAAARLEARHGVRVEPGARGAAIDLTRRFEPYRAFPGKAVRLLEDVVQEALAADPPLERVDREHCIASFARRSGLPLALLSDDEPLSPATVRAFAEERLLGQPEAVDAVVDLLTVLKAGLNDPRKPLAGLFFVGPTGVGKTELAKVLAELLFSSRDRLVRFDMGEHASSDAVPRLIGSAWRGADEREGELTRRIREQPFCVLLLDELEKAHPDVFDLLLSALGEGRLTDANGRTADLRNAIVVMTSNLGATKEARPIGFGEGGADAARHYAAAAERFFRPEFFNRIDRIVAFRPLSEDVVRRIARRELGRLLLREGVTRRQLLVEIDDAVVDVLARRGLHPRYGARPLQREIERAVILPLARTVVEQAPGPGDLLRFRVRDDAIVLDVSRLPGEVEARPAAPKAQAPRTGSLSRLVERCAAAERAVVEEADGPVARALRDEVGALLEATHRPTFWDDADAARETLARVYELERVLDALDGLRRRAGGLAELARGLQRRDDRRRAREVGDAAAAIEDALELARLELGVASAPAGGPAIIRVSSVGPDADEWAARLLRMYAAWAERTGREADRLDEPAAGLALRDGTSYALLSGEAGLHRLSRRGRPSLLARVTVLSAEGGLAAEPAPDAPVVRIYREGRERSVRDPRSGVEVHDVDAVLAEGRIEPFLL